MIDTIVKVFCYQLLITIYIFSQEPFFNKLERQLRYQEEQAIADVLYAAKKLPQPECLTLLRNIEKARNTIKKTLFGNCDQQCSWTPQQDTVTPNVIQDHNDLTMGKIALYTAQYANMLGIKSGVIKTVYKPSKKNNYIYAFVKATDLKENDFKIHFCIDYMNAQHRVFPHTSHTILHELTHIIEGHPLIKYLIISTVQRYYSNYGLSTDLVQKIKALVLIYETIADIVPLIWSNEVSSIQKIYQYACKIGILSFSLPIDDVHLTADQCAIYNAKIYTQHKDRSLEKLLFILGQMPILKRLFFQKSCIYTMQISLGLFIGAYIGNKIV